MYCNYCGKVIQENAVHCAFCGKRVGAVVARKRLVRPRYNRVISGVSAGMAEYFDLDVSLIRLAWILLVIFGVGVGIIAYIVAWIVIPEEPEVLVAAAPPPAHQHDTVRS